MMGDNTWVKCHIVNCMESRNVLLVSPSLVLANSFGSYAVTKTYQNPWQSNSLLNGNQLYCNEGHLDDLIVHGCQLHESPLSK